MTVLRGTTLVETGIDAVALKPATVDLQRAHDLDVSALVVDYEGREHFPDPAVLADLAAAFDLRVTVPVRADGFDPLGEDSYRSSLPPGVGEIFVAGNSDYLSDDEARRAVAPRLGAAVKTAEDPWVGTEGIERLALAAGSTQFDLLSATTARDARALRAAGFEGDIAVYAPTVLADEPDAILDALGPYVARRGRVREKLSGDPPVDSAATGETRETLLESCREYALVGDPMAVQNRIDHLTEAGVDRVVSYPARGLDALLE